MPPSPSIPQQQVQQQQQPQTQQPQQEHQEQQLPSSLLWAYQLRRENIHLATQLTNLQSRLAFTEKTTESLQQTVANLERQVEQLGVVNEGLREEVEKFKVTLSAQVVVVRNDMVQIVGEESVEVESRLGEIMSREQGMVDELRAEQAESIKEMGERVREAVLMEVRRLLDEERRERERAGKERDKQKRVQLTEEGAAQQGNRTDRQSSSDVLVPDSWQSTDTVFSFERMGRPFEGLADAPPHMSRAPSELSKIPSCRRAYNTGPGKSDAKPTTDVCRNDPGRFEGERKIEVTSGPQDARPTIHQPRPKQRPRRHIPIVPLDEEDEMLLAQTVHHVESLDGSH